METIQTIALLRSARLLRRVLVPWGYLLSLKLHWKTINVSWWEKLSKSSYNKNDPSRWMRRTNSSGILKAKWSPHPGQTTRHSNNQQENENLSNCRLYCVINSENREKLIIIGIFEIQTDHRILSWIPNLMFLKKKKIIFQEEDFSVQIYHRMKH